MENDFLEENYDIVNKVFSNPIKTLYKAKDKNTNLFVMIKEYNRKGGLYVEALYKMEKFILEQLNSLLKENDLPYIIQLIKANENSKHMYIITEYCFGNLEDYIKLNNNKLSIDNIRTILLQLNNVLKLFRQKRIIHRNIKPSNILISYNNNNEIIIKLSGVSHCYKEITITDEVMPKQKNIFTPPEGIKELETKEKYDLWSIGILIYYMLFYEYPYEDYNKFNEIKNNINIKNIVDNDLKDLISKLLIINDTERISWEDYFKHPFFNFEKKDFLKLRYIQDLSTLKNEINELYLNLIKKKKEEREKEAKEQYTKFKEIYLEIQKIKKELELIYKK
jgi:serine/threonine-protein kinase ULK/ATG1